MPKGKRTSTLDRARRRNIMFGRNPKGNTTPEERRANWKASKSAAVLTASKHIVKASDGGE